MSETEKLEPCPFCGGGHIGITTISPHHTAWEAHCLHCGGHGAACISRAEAIAAWNRRALTSRSEVLEEAARVADEAAKRASDADSENARELGDAYDPNCYGAGYNCGACEYSAEIAAAIRALKKDKDNG